MWTNRKQGVLLNGWIPKWTNIVAVVPEGSLLAPMLLLRFFFFYCRCTFYGRLNFDYCVSQICKKFSKKLHSLVRMFHSRNTDKRASKKHERDLDLVYNDSLYLRFDEMLRKLNLVSIYQRNLRFLATETSRWRVVRLLN